jgi:hypothetical protein
MPKTPSCNYDPHPGWEASWDKELVFLLIFVLLECFGSAFSELITNLKLTPCSVNALPI